MNNSLNISETIAAPPTANDKYTEWFSVDVILVVILLFVDIALIVVFRISKGNLKKLYISQLTHRGNGSGDHINLHTTSDNPLKFKKGLLKD